MSEDQLLLIDLSALAHQIWHISGNEPDPSFVSTQLVARVRGLASQHPHAAICCDSGKSFRADLDPTYKAQRDTENRAPLRHQMDVACETLKKDGFPIWRAKGFEADDLIATATAKALAIDGATVLIASADKDLLQLVSDRVTFKSTSPNTDGKLFTPADVFDKFGVQPAQMGDLLALMGDASDNIKGADKIGKVIGARLLAEHGSLAALYAAIDNGGDIAGVTAGMGKSLLEFRSRWPLVASLIALRADVPEGDGFGFAEIAAERTAAPMEEASTMTIDDYADTDQRQPLTDPVPEGGRVPFQQGNDANDAPLFAQSTQPQNGPAPVTVSTSAPLPVMPAPRQELKPEPDPTRNALAPYAPVDFSQQLEPRSMDEAVRLAQRMFESRLFSAYGTPQAVLATVLAGRELGIPAMASLRAFHIIEGKPTMSAGTIQSLVLKSKHAQYFRCTERTAERATFVTKRGDDPEMALTYTIEEGKQAWSKDDSAWKKSGWGRNPADMLVARAASKLARLVYPDVVAGLYAPEEME